MSTKTAARIDAFGSGIPAKVKRDWIISRRLFFPMVMGVVGIAVLLSLGFWQLQRLAWKEAILAEIDARLSGAPVALPVQTDPQIDRFLPVTASGRLTGEELTVLWSDGGAGYRVISVLETDGRRVMVDLGFVPLDAQNTPRLATAINVTGNLHWPDEVDRWTPAPDVTKGIWFARDVPAMAVALNAEPVLIVAAALSGDASVSALGVTPLPIDSTGIPNDHLTYAITWFALAFVWAVMTGFLLFRVARAARKD